MKRLIIFSSLLLPLVANAENQGAVRILDSQVVDLGTRKITYNRIETPALKTQPEPEAVPVVEAKDYVPTAEELAEIRYWESLRYENLGGVATVYKERGTEFRLWTEDGEVVALSSIGFNFFGNLWDFVRRGTYYSVFFFALELGSIEVGESGDWLPAGEFPKEEGGVSRFTLVSAPEGEAGEKAVQALEDLHAYFDENRKQLRAAYEEGEKARIAQEEWVKAHPPTPQDTVVNFFPIRSSTHPVKTSVQVEETSK